MGILPLTCVLSGFLWTLGTMVPQALALSSATLSMACGWWFQMLQHMDAFRFPGSNRVMPWSMLPNADALAASDVAGAIGCLEVHRSKLLIGRRVTTWDIICSVEFCQLGPEGFGPYASAKDFLPIPPEQPFSEKLLIWNASQCPPWGTPIWRFMQWRSILSSLGWSIQKNPW